MEEIKELIAKNLIHFRTSAGLTQLELAERLNYSDKSVSKWERGLAVPDVLVLKQLADLYGIKVDDFFSEGENLAKIELEPSTKAGKRLLISLLSVGLAWLVATLCFVVLLWLDVDRAWLSFVVAVPVSSIVSIVFSCLWGRLWVTAVLVSLLTWTIAVSAHLIFYWTMAKLLYLLCIPIQILIIMWYILMYLVKKRKYNNGSNNNKLNIVEK
ncbi:MAG: helix-turn-helix transcriptional regulator [Clostridia bacterium]|nr:helix-turn-helix transcriptional regulator [Clostridia bacterium]